METKKSIDDPNVPTRLEAKSDPPPPEFPRWDDISGKDVQVLEDDGEPE
jgi:hypothetical protein